MPISYYEILIGKIMLHSCHISPGRPNTSFRIKSITFQSVHLRFIWSILNKSEICFRRTDSFVVKVRITRFDYDSFFSVRIDASSSFRIIPHQSEQNSHSVWIRLIAQMHSEWCCAIPRSVRMIPCHYALSPNDSVTHSNGLGSERFGKRFGIYTELHEIILIPNESETCIREVEPSRIEGE